MIPAVLYTHQLEPITVLEVSNNLWDRLRRGDTIKLRVLEKFTLATIDEPVRCRDVTIIGETIRRHGCETLMLFTADEENALLLKAAFLPGQREELNRRSRHDFARGFANALMNFRG